MAGDPQLRFYHQQLIMISDALEGYGHPFVDHVGEMVVQAAIELDAIIGGSMRKRIEKIMREKK